MTNKEVLERVIQKAIDGGWNPVNFNTIKNSYHHPEESEFHDILGDWHNISPLDIIFNHDFAKSLWPGEPMGNGVTDPRATSPSTAKPLIPLWQARLMEMVVSDDPIAYLGKHI